MKKHRFAVNHMMKFIFVFFLSISCAVLCDAQPKGSFTARVIKIVDGDTFDAITSDKKVYRIRMNGIDCPERKQAFYQVSKDALARYIFGKKVILISNSSDRYRRLLADVYNGSNHINRMMIANGFAWHYTRYSKDKSLAKAEADARMFRKGLWQQSNPIPPWTFKANRKKRL